MTAFVTQVHPTTKRVLTLPCSHSQPSAAKAGSTIDCQTCGHPWKITRAIVAAAEAKAAPDKADALHARRPRAGAAPATVPGAWKPPPIIGQQPDEQPGDCPNCGTQRSWAGRASMAWCDDHGAGLAPRTQRAHTRAAGLQQHRDTSERDGDAENLYQRVEAILDVLDPLLDDPALDTDDRGTLRWLREEFIKARRDKTRHG